MMLKKFEKINKKIEIFKKKLINFNFIYSKIPKNY